MTNFDLKILNLADGDYEITVVARADGYKPSEPSNAVSYVVESETLSAGLYDANDTLVASWDSLVNDYGMRCDVNYTFNGQQGTLRYVMINNSELANGVKLIIGNVTSIGNYAFGGGVLRSVIIPDSVTSIGNNAFYDCGSLTSVEIPDSVTSIGGGAFNSCSSLTNIVIPDSVTSIGGTAFRYCVGPIYCEAESQPDGWDSSWNSSYYGDIIWGYKGEETQDELQGTWLWHNYFKYLNIGEAKNYTLNFSVNGVNYTQLKFLGYEGPEDLTQVKYDNSVVYDGVVWVNDNYRYMVISSKLAEVTNGTDLLTLLKDCATKLITFTIDGTTYQAENGMTWGEWVDSEYNTGDNIWTDSTQDIVIVGTGYMIKGAIKTDVIVAGNAYVTEYAPSSGEPA